MRIVLATSNKGKINEFKKLLPTDDVVAFSELLGEMEIIEDADTFKGNAIIKAKTIYDKLNDENAIVISDDSGISVPELSNEPGIYSARYAGESASDKDNLHKLIDELNKKLELIDNYCVLIDEFNQSEFEITISSLNYLSKEIDDIKDLINYNKIEIIEIEKEIGKTDAYSEICNLETEIELLNIEENSLIKEKDNLIFMKGIIKLSNEAFKEENQPNIIKDVNKLFSLITGNKYDKLYINESTKEIFIKLDKFNKEINEGFSRGTKDQLFLALRFALINHYEKEVKLPIVLDEIFANWDDFRINNFIKSLNHIVSDRQLIFLTCKKSVLDAFENIDGLDVNLLKIDCE
jgi:uncharacterized protein YhaN